MKHLKLTTAIALISSALSTTALAEEQTIEQSWEATAELGFVMTGGNSDTETLNAKFNAATSYTDWKHSLHLEALNSSSNNVSSAEKYFVEAQSDRKISERAYALGVLTWEKDRFSGYGHQTSIALGLGYKVLNENDMELDLELAPGYRVIEDNNGNNEEDGIIRLSEVFSWNLSETSKLDQFLKSEMGDSNTITRFGISLTSQVQEALSMKVGYNLKHSSDVPTGAKKTDRETSITLVYKL